MLAARAASMPDAVCLIEAESGASVTYGELHADSLRAASWLASCGVRAGDTVATMFAHSIDTYRVWFGLAAIGAMEVPIGTRYRGRMLRHILGDSGAQVLIIDDALLEEAGALDVPTVIRRGPGLALTESVLASPRTAQAQDVSIVIYTSGTTGPSKGVLVPWGQVQSTIEGAFPPETFAGPSAKVIYGPFPPNHIGGRLFAGLGIHEGVPTVVRHTFSASNFWTDVARHKCTTVGLVSAMASMLLSAPVAANDADNCMTDVLLVPMIAEFEAFERRFGVRLCTSFNMTEVSIPITSGWTVSDWRSCGYVRSGYPGYELRVVDEFDQIVAPGIVGELVCRTSEPWTLNAGYFGHPVATSQAWRNGWFHTGDAFRYDEAGRYYFVDRIKDAIRRRGENISSIEVEQEVLDHPLVEACAAIGVPSELGEQDIKVFVVPRPGAPLTEADVIAHVAAKAASFMVPRYVELVDSLPTTDGTDRVKKSELRAISRTQPPQGGGSRPKST